MALAVLALPLSFRLHPHCPCPFSFLACFSIFVQLSVPLAAQVATNPLPQRTSVQQLPSHPQDATAAQLHPFIYPLSMHRLQSTTSCIQTWPTNKFNHIAASSNLEVLPCWPLFFRGGSIPGVIWGQRNDFIHCLGSLKQVHPWSTNFSILFPFRPSGRLIIHAIHS